MATNSDFANYAQIKRNVIADDKFFKNYIIKKMKSVNRNINIYLKTKIIDVHLGIIKYFDLLEKCAPDDESSRRRDNGSTQDNDSANEDSDGSDCEASKGNNEISENNDQLSEDGDELSEDDDQVYKDSNRDCAPTDSNQISEDNHKIFDDNVQVSKDDNKSDKVSETNNNNNTRTPNSEYASENQSGDESCAMLFRLPKQPTSDQQENTEHNIPDRRVKLLYALLLNDDYFGKFLMGMIKHIDPKYKKFAKAVLFDAVLSSLHYIHVLNAQEAFFTPDFDESRASTSNDEPYHYVYNPSNISYDKNDIVKYKISHMFIDDNDESSSKSSQVSDNEDAFDLNLESILQESDLLSIVLNPMTLDDFDNIEKIDDSGPDIDLTSSDEQFSPGDCFEVPTCEDIVEFHASTYSVHQESPNQDESRASENSINLELANLLENRSKSRKDSLSSDDAELLALLVPTCEDIEEFRASINSFLRASPNLCENESTRRDSSSFDFCELLSLHLPTCEEQDESRASRNSVHLESSNPLEKGSKSRKGSSFDDLELLSLQVTTCEEKDDPRVSTSSVHIASRNTCEKGSKGRIDLSLSDDSELVPEDMDKSRPLRNSVHRVSPNPSEKVSKRRRNSSSSSDDFELQALQTSTGVVSDDPPALTDRFQHESQIQSAKGLKRKRDLGFDNCDEQETPRSILNQPRALTSGLRPETPIPRQPLQVPKTRRTLEQPRPSTSELQWESYIPCMPTIRSTLDQPHASTSGLQRESIIQCIPTIRNTLDQPCASTSGLQRESFIPCISRTRSTFDLSRASTSELPWESYIPCMPTIRSTLDQPRASTSGLQLESPTPCIPPIRSIWDQPRAFTGGLQRESSIPCLPTIRTLDQPRASTSGLQRESSVLRLPTIRSTLDQPRASTIGLQRESPIPCIPMIRNTLDQPRASISGLQRESSTPYRALQTSTSRNILDQPRASTSGLHLRSTITRERNTRRMSDSSSDDSIGEPSNMSRISDNNVSNKSENTNDNLKCPKQTFSLQRNINTPIQKVKPIPSTSRPCNSIPVLRNWLDTGLHRNQLQRNVLTTDEILERLNMSSNYLNSNSTVDDNLDNATQTNIVHDTNLIVISSSSSENNDETQENISHNSICSDASTAMSH
ncbi:PREDICTED: uncharacterized protein LOC108567727 [Nicrophorus vespilloides]|uniref:Uncharacterized protein LOC108567727 n=1 Tax=Nicrophorus vespilloides TaxID=110193 RepID=A0ABM1NAH8_NICVS|nr:PREDICTED: uncharacterized protein LOC108567727 [Nicrophorus vespilloides]